ncbi:MAG TPA: cytochrome P450 [Streptosporangiaceae bacterium]|jgi:cytochrome P450
MTEQLPRYPFGWPSATEQPREFADLHDSPVVPVTLPSGDTALLITRYDDIRGVLTDPRVSKNRNRPGVARMTDKKVKAFQSQVSMDPPEHTRMRRLISQAFTPSRVEKLRPRIQDIATELTEQIASGPQPADLAEALAFPLSIRVICEMLGVPARDRARFTGGGPPPWDYMRELIARKREDPADDLISALIQVHDEDDGELSAEELLWWSTVLLLAGYETTANQICSAVVLLLTHPEQLAALRADYGQMPQAVEELLRYQVVGTSLSMLRYVTADITVAGTDIPAGSSVITSLESANFDPRAFSCPARLDISRAGQPQLTFSVGRHFCVGAALARAELQVTLETLLRRFPDLRLAVPASDLRRHDDAFTQGFAAVPVCW